MLTPDPLLRARAAGRRCFGRWELVRLLGKSDLTMAWQVHDPHNLQALMLVLPRTQPAEAHALAHWQQAVRLAARLGHPQLAAVQETGLQDGWPFVAYDLQDGQVLSDTLDGRGLSGAQAAALGEQLLQGLAFAHDAGLPHLDLQHHLLLLGPQGELRLAGLGVAAAGVALAPGAGPQTVASVDTAQHLHRQRAAAEQDVLAVGVLLHAWLTGRPPLDEPELGRVLRRLGQHGREGLSLPWSLAQPLADPLRAIVNRATQAQERLRYRNARTLLRALQGWLQTERADGGDPLALLADRLRNAGVLPAGPGAAARAARLNMMERERSHELAEVVLQDPALSFELLRSVNTAQVRGAQLSGSGPVLTVRRAIAMLGLDGVRRAALALRPWPGPLQPQPAEALKREINRCKKAARLAVALRPAGYDGEVVYLITLLQNLGWLVVYYHFAEEAQQIERLMQPLPPTQENALAEPGLDESAAAYAVLGSDIQAIGMAVARQWGLDDAVLQLIRRMPPGRPPRQVDSEEELLRCLASCAIEAVEAAALPAARQRAGLQRVVQRWARVLGLEMRALLAALSEQHQGQASPPISQTQSAPLTEAVDPGGPHARAAASSTTWVAGSPGGPA